MYTTAANVLGHLKCKNTDWFQEHDEEIQLLLAKKQKAHKQYLACDSQHNKMVFLLVRAKVQKRIWKMKDDWWNSKAKELQRLVGVYDYQGLFAALRAVYGPCGIAVAPVKKCWWKCFTHWLERYNWMLERTLFKPLEPIGGSRWKGNITNVCSYTKGWPVYYYHDGRARESMKPRRGKAPGLDGISPEILKLGRPKLKAHLLSLYNTCWQRQTLPQDFKDALIVMIYKRKGERKDCDNHHGISLLSIAGKVLAKIMLNRLKTISEQLHPEYMIRT